MMEVVKDLIKSDLKECLYLKVLCDGITPHFIYEPEFNYYYKPFQIGDILECIEKDKEIIINVIRNDTIIHQIDGMTNLQFKVSNVINGKFLSTRLSLFGILKFEKMRDITTEFLRNNKIDFILKN